MTDKQIINSCEFQSRCIQYKDMYSNKHIKGPIVDFAIACRGENKCKYKTVYEQLKRKEEECEKLKEEIKINGFGCFNIEMSEQLDQLKAENDGLKTMLKDLSYENQKFCYQIEEQTKQLEPFKDEYFKGLDMEAIAELAKKSIRLATENRELEDENEKLKNCLTEIKRITEKHKVTAHCDYLIDMDKILQKIREVEDENS